MKMTTRELGSTNLRLSTMGLGTWTFGGGDYKFGWGPQDDKESIATIRRAVEMGINWFDTAPSYGSGRSEKIIGQALKEISENILVATKCGVRMAENKEDILFNLKRDSLRKEVENSLKRLQLETIDLYMIHKPMPEEELEEGWSTLIDLKKEGKIRHAGVSSLSIEQLKRVQAIHPVAFIQPEYNMLEPDIENKLLPYCAENNIGVIVYSPMASGLLTGKFTREKYESLPDDDWRRESDPHFEEPNFSTILNLIESLKPIAEKNNKTPAQLAVAWVLRRSEVTSAIVGARKAYQIEQTIPAGNWVLSDEDKAQLDHLLTNYYTLMKKIKSGNQDG